VDDLIPDLSKGLTGRIGKEMDCRDLAGLDCGEAMEEVIRDREF
jgi:hypothetical protein